VADGGQEVVDETGNERGLARPAESSDGEPHGPVVQKRGQRRQAIEPQRR
jgi:hypothetical protein